MQGDYFVISRANTPAHPLLEWDQDPWEFRRGTPVAATQPVRLRLGDPVPASPSMVDHHSLPDPVFSGRVKEVLERLAISGSQLVPADVRMPSGAVLRYWLLHTHQEIACMDRGLSRFSIDPDGEVLGIEKLVLDSNVLRAVPERARLVFALKEDLGVRLFHRSVVEAVLGVQPPPEGVRFFPVADWDDSADFRP
ncbi:hypothetical protein HUW62_46895 [Myxococcus sp. AM011]|uniref:imm11 family protein n=1 Tax=Myxococcus sp. AM011 TaxID=2745200 RepID=UPI0015955D8F|nr:DUF1629 domain-containing protein [Myxococcus sp. AM011]NVJ28746.1 hypothetical protein [Myxococcus sp. AM011]